MDQTINMIRKQLEPAIVKVEFKDFRNAVALIDAHIDQVGPEDFPDDRNVPDFFESFNSVIC